MQTTQIIDELSKVTISVTDSQIETMLNQLHEAHHIFVSGAGRSGLMIKAFANRLLQLGLPVSIIGELTAPHTEDKDVLIFNSASGTSPVLLSQAIEAKKNNLKIFLFTTDEFSPLSKYANETIQISAQSKYSHTDSFQPMGALFEQYSLLLFDSLVIKYMNMFNVDEENMRSNHANIE